MRPALVFQAAEAVGGTAEAAIPAAVAVELVHNFSLLHDDVMDNDRMRRHRPTAWVVFGAPAAILAGDALLVLATQILAESDGPLAVLGEALLTLVHGQCADLTFADRAGVSLAECLEMASAKTGALLGGACALGAYAGGADPDRAAALLADVYGLPYVDVRASITSLIPRELPADLAARLVDAWVDRLVANPHLHDKLESQIVISSLGLRSPGRLGGLRLPEQDVKQLGACASSPTT